MLLMMCRASKLPLVQSGSRAELKFSQASVLPRGRAKEVLLRGRGMEARPMCLSQSRRLSLSPCPFQHPSREQLVKNEFRSDSPISGYGL